MLLDLIEKLPVDLLGTLVLGYFDLSNIVRLEIACGSRESYQLFLNLIPHAPPVVLPSSKQLTITALEWFANRRCKLDSIIMYLPNISALYVKNLHVDKLELHLQSNTTVDEIKPLFNNPMSYIVKTIIINCDLDILVLEQLSICTSNVNKLQIYSSCFYRRLNKTILSRWKLKTLYLDGIQFITPLLTLIVQTCSELTTIQLSSNTLDDAVVMIVAQHCPKLEKLILHEILETSTLTYQSLLTLSEYKLPLQELSITHVPIIPTADIARSCSHALSCIRNFNPDNFVCNQQSRHNLIPYMTGLTSIHLDYSCHSYIPLLLQYCHKLTELNFSGTSFTDTVILSLIRANPLLQRIGFYHALTITDTVLIEVVQTCKHLHTLTLPYTHQISELTLSEHCHQICINILL